MKAIITIISLLLLTLDVITCTSTAESVRVCDKENVCKFSMDFKTIPNGNQVIDINVTIPFPFGNNVRVSTKLFLWTINRWTELITIRDEDICHFCVHNFGQVFYDIQKTNGVPPGKCPIQPKQYIFNNYELKFNNMAFKNFPKGKIKILYQAFRKADNKEVLCIDAIAKSI